MENSTSNLSPFADVLVKLLQGTLYDESKSSWNELLVYQKQINQYVEQIGLELIVEKRDGYAFLRQIELDESGRTIGLMRRRSLSYEQTLLCVLLREWIDEFEQEATDSHNLYITHREFRDRIEVFFKDQSNKAKLLRELDRYIREMVSFGFLRQINNEGSPEEEQYEVRRIIKSRITTEKLEEFKQKLLQYAESV